MPKVTRKPTPPAVSRIRSINWLNHFIELMVVILGVTIAFMLNSWKESRDISKSENEYLQSIVNDLNADIVFLDTLSILTQSNLASLDSLLDVIQSNDFSNDSLIRSYHFHFQSQSDFLTRNVTYLSMLNSGKLEIIQDFKLKMSIIQLYQSDYDHLNLIEKNYNELMRNHVIPYAAENFVYNVPMVENKEYFTSNKFIGMVYSIRYSVEYKMDLYNRFRDHAIQLKSDIQEYLKE